MKITFKAICEAESGIEELYNLAKMIGRRRSKTFCANAIWYDLFKPKMVELVGHGRQAKRLEIEKKAKKLKQEGKEFIESKEMGFTFFEMGPGDPCFNDNLRWLETSEAYNLAYENIYNALPDCTPDHFG